MDTVARKPYPSDLTDEQWELIELVIPSFKPGGRPRAVSMREVVNAMLYLNRAGCQCDMLPHDLPAPRARRRPPRPPTPPRARGGARSAASWCWRVAPAPRRRSWHPPLPSGEGAGGEGLINSRAPAQ